MRTVCLILLWALVGCAPMPGNTLFPGLTEPTALKDIDNLTITIDDEETTRICNAGVWNGGNYYPVFLNCLINLCIIPGCAEVLWGDDGHIHTCNVYMSWDWDWLRAHELRHCMGYDDILY